MAEQVVLITGTRKGIGRYLAEYYLDRGYHVVGCSRADSDLKHDRYQHHCIDVEDEKRATALVRGVAKEFGKLDVLINNAGIASMNHVMLTPLSTVKRVFATNVLGMFTFCREAARVMMKQRWGRIVNFATVARPLKLEGEAAYAASKAAVESFTEVLARELASFGITVNAVGPTPVQTDLIRGVSDEKIRALVNMQAIKRLGEYRDISNVVDFFIRPESDFVTGQVIFLGGIR